MYFATAPLAVSGTGVKILDKIAALAAARCRPVRAPLGTHKKSPLFLTADFLVGCPVGLEPTVSRSTIWRVNRLRYGHHINAPEGTRTPGPLLRRQLLYPPELRAHVVIPMGSFYGGNVLSKHAARSIIPYRSHPVKHFCKKLSRKNSAPVTAATCPPSRGQTPARHRRAHPWGSAHR